MKSARYPSLRCCAPDTTAPASWVRIQRPRAVPASRWLRRVPAPVLEVPETWTAVCETAGEAVPDAARTPHEQLWSGNWTRTQVAARTHSRIGHCRRGMGRGCQSRQPGRTHGRQHYAAQHAQPRQHHQPPPSNQARACARVHAMPAWSRDSLRRSAPPTSAPWPRFAAGGALGLQARAVSTSHRLAFVSGKETRVLCPCVVYWPQEGFATHNQVRRGHGGAGVRLRRRPPPSDTGPTRTTRATGSDSTDRLTVKAIDSRLAKR